MEQTQITLLANLILSISSQNLSPQNKKSTQWNIYNKTAKYTLVQVSFISTAFIRDLSSIQIHSNTTPIQKWFSEENWILIVLYIYYLNQIIPNYFGCFEWSLVVCHITWSGAELGVRLDNLVDGVQEVLLCCHLAASSDSEHASFCAHTANFSSWKISISNQEHH